MKPKITMRALSGAAVLACAVPSIADAGKVSPSDKQSVLEEVHEACRDAQGKKSRDCDGSYACTGRPSQWEWSTTCLATCRDWSERECERASYYDEDGERAYDCAWDRKHKECEEVRVDEDEHVDLRRKLEEVHDECVDAEGKKSDACDGSYACVGRASRWAWGDTCVDHCRDLSAADCGDAGYYDEDGERAHDCAWDRKRERCEKVDVSDAADHDDPQQQLEVVHDACVDAEGKKSSQCDGAYACIGRVASWAWGETCADSCDDWAKDECERASYYDEDGERAHDCAWDRERERCEKVDVQDESVDPREQLAEVHDTCVDAEGKKSSECDGSYACVGAARRWAWGETCVDSCRDLEEDACDDAGYYDEDGVREYDCAWDSKRERCRKVDVSDDAGSDDTGYEDTRDKLEDVNDECVDDEGKRSDECDGSYACVGRIDSWEWSHTCLDACSDWSEEECLSASYYNEDGVREYDCVWHQSSGSCRAAR